MSDIIFRIQDSEGRGPYRPGTPAKWVDTNRDESERPPFFNEFGVSPLRKIFTWEVAGSGFRTLEQLCKWFSFEERRKLEKMGYQIVTMEASRVIAESDKQLVFTRREKLNKDVKVIEWGGVV